MFKKKVIITLCIISSIGIQVNGKMLEFLTKDLDEFIQKTILNQTDQRAFRIYFDRLLEKIKESSDQKKRATRQYLYQIAWKNLEQKHLDWHGEINPFFTDARYTMDETFDGIRNHIRHFLTWYGAYEEYLTVRVYAQQNTQAHHEIVTQKHEVGTEQNESKKEPKVIEVVQEGLWGTIKSYAQKVKQKFAGWFGFSDTSVVT